MHACIAISTWLLAPGPWPLPSQDLLHVGASDSASGQVRTVPVPTGSALLYSRLGTHYV
jgi:hypothetical protein